MGAGIGGPLDAYAAPRPAADEGANTAASSSAATAVVHGGHPDVSADGRWLVYAGVPTDGSLRASTIWLRDTTAPHVAPVELTVPVDGIREGSSVLPAISGDGCFVVAITEMAYDFFRDDDEDLRWDVYRLELPHCLDDDADGADAADGGPDEDGAAGSSAVDPTWTPTDWELVSTEQPGVSGRASGPAGASGSPELGGALDRVSPTDPPAVSETGGVIVYTQQARRGRDPLTSVTLVDLTIPLGHPNRSATVRGTPGVLPPESEGTAPTFLGQRQPAVSADGRFVAYTSDARSDLVEPVWDPSQVEAAGDVTTATSHVYLWDRMEPDPARAVAMVSARPSEAVAPVEPRVDPMTGVVIPGPVEPAEPSNRGAATPDVSGNGRYVVFTSSSTDLVDGLTMPACGERCPTQVYRYDRIEGTNELVSRQPAAVPTDGGEVAPGGGAAADRGASQPAISEDGSQVAFTTRSTNLFTTVSQPGTELGDGEIVVSLVELGELSRVSVLPDGVTPAPGTNANPVLSATGGVIVFDTLSAHALTGSDAPGRQVVALRRKAQVAAPDLDVGTVVVTYPGPEWRIGVKNLGPSTWVPASVVSSTADFAVTGGTCHLGVPVLPGHYCDVFIVLTPSVAGPITGELTIAEAGHDPVVVRSKLSGQGGEPLLAPSPAGADFADTIVGEESPSITFDITNIGFTIGTVTQLRMSGAHPGDFEVDSSTCRGREVIPGGACSVSVVFTPTEAGYRTATLLAISATGQYTGILLDGTGRFEPTATLAADTVVAGEPIGIGGAGFAPRADVTISWADGSGTSTVVRTDATGGFLALFDTRRHDRAGDRQIVVQGPHGSVTVPLRVLRRSPGGPASPTWGG